MSDEHCTLPLNPRGEVLIDRADLPMLSHYRWCVGRDGYPRRYYYEHGVLKAVRLHNVLMPRIPGYSVDHSNGNKLDNRRCNLRYATPSQQRINTTRPRNNTSQYKGVYYRKDNRRWAARISYQGRCYSLGVFHSAEQAARAYNAKASELAGQYARLNFPEAGETQPAAADLRPRRRDRAM